MTKLDYCNSVLAGTPMYLQQRLQSVLNAAARLVFSARRSDHITPLLQELHWLRVPEHIQFRICVLAYRCLHGTAPSYIANDTCLTSGIEARRRLRSSSASTMIVPPVRRSLLLLAAVRFQWRRLGLGTVYHLESELLAHSNHSAKPSKLIYCVFPLLTV